MATACNRPPPSSSLHPRPILLAGPTAVGKSGIALLLAERLNGEIVSVDSMQVYRGLDIGTAKPSAEERARVPHHLIDVVDVTGPFDAAKFAELAHQAVTEIRSRNRLPILCGGTGLYFKAFLDGLGEAPPADEQLRAALRATPPAELLRELAESDPATFEKIDRLNLRRVIRAVEVIRLTGRPFSAQKARWSRTPCGSSGALGSPGSPGASPDPGRPFLPSFGLSRSQSDLVNHINERVDGMFRDGLVAETEQLLKRGLADNKTAMQALGYRQVAEHLRGGRSLTETIELVKIRTRQFAKRQMTWFKRQLSLEWFELKPEDSPDIVAALVEARIEKTFP
jgi:tRNA dimethylallyltransferase